MGQRNVAHIAISLLLLPVIAIPSSDSINLQADSSQSVGMFDGSGQGPGQVTISAEIRDTETNLTEESLSSSSNESSGDQKQFLSDETLSSTENLGTLHSVSNLHLSSEGNNEASLKASSSPINSTDLIAEYEDDSEFQQYNNKNFSPLLESDDPLNINLTEDDSASFNVSNPSYIDASHVAPQKYTADVTVNADNVSVIKGDENNISSQSDKDNVREDSSEQTLDEHSFNQRLNFVPILHQNQTAGDQNNADVNEIQGFNSENYNRSESQSQEMNESIEDPQEQSDSPTVHYLNNSFDSEETFEKVFSISVNDSADREQKQYFNYQTGAEQHADKSPVSNIQVSGSDTEHSTADNNMNFNDFSVLNNAFEVYHYSRKPDPNDTDGAKQNKTLAQHIEELVLNRLPSLDNHKVSEYQGGDEIGSENHEEDYIPLDVEISPDEISESDDEETRSGATLAFVFDSTGSMWDDLVQVKMGAERIMATMLERPDKPIYNYVLVPFHDPSKLSRLYFLKSLVLCNLHI